MEKVSINKNVIIDLVKLTEEVNEKVESLLLMSDEEVMEGHKRAKEQIEKRDFGNWNEL